MTEPKKQPKEPTPDPLELIRQAWKKAGTDIIRVEVRSGMSIPLLSIWEFDDLLFQCVGVFSDGSVELARVQRK